MSAPADRLISEREAARFQGEAEAILAEYPHAAKLREQAMATLALARDRSARQELAAVQRYSKPHCLCHGR